MDAQVKEGDVVIIEESHHADVPKGTEGIVKAIYPTGYGVEVSGRFLISGANARTENSTEVIWVDKDKLHPKI